MLLFIFIHNILSNILKEFIYINYIYYILSFCSLLQISIENISLNILDESGPAPLKILVRRLGIERTKEGQVIVEPCIPPDHSELFETVSSELDQLRAENEQLRRRLAALDILNNENHRLRKFQEEAQELRYFQMFIVLSVQIIVVSTFEDRISLVKRGELLRKVVGFEP